jgi:hypothetical protein
MNGRMYDPQQGRFLSPDNHIQDPFNTQNFNRYGYVLNNPLSLTDPSGEFFETVFAIVKAISYAMTAIQAIASIADGAPVFNVLLGVGIGLLAGELGGNLAKGIKGLFSAATTAAGALIRGAISAFGGQLISGTLASVVQGTSFKQALRANFAPAGIAAAMGGIAGASEFKAARKATIADAKRRVAEVMEGMAEDAYAGRTGNSSGGNTPNVSGGPGIWGDITMDEFVSLGGNDPFNPNNKDWFGYEEWAIARKYEDFINWYAENPFVPPTPRYPSGYAKPMGFDSPFFGLAGTGKLAASSGFKLTDYVRMGKTIIPPGVSGKTKPVFTFAIKGGGKNMSFHYHVHKYNWYKPRTWFKYTPIKK